MDVVWLRLPRQPGDPRDLGALHVGAGRFCILLEREADWQVGYVIAKGGYQQLRQNLFAKENAGLPGIQVIDQYDVAVILAAEDPGFMYALVTGAAYVVSGVSELIAMSPLLLRSSRASVVSSGTTANRTRPTLAFSPQ